MFLYEGSDAVDLAMNSDVDVILGIVCLDISKTELLRQHERRHSENLGTARKINKVKLHSMFQQKDKSCRTKDCPRIIHRDMYL